MTEQGRLLILDAEDKYSYRGRINNLPCSVSIGTLPDEREAMAFALYAIIWRGTSPCQQ